MQNIQPAAANEFSANPVPGVTRGLKDFYRNFPATQSDAKTQSRQPAPDNRDGFRDHVEDWSAAKASIMVGRFLRKRRAPAAEILAGVFWRHSLIPRLWPTSPPPTIVMA